MHSLLYSSKIPLFCFFTGAHFLNNNKEVSALRVMGIDPGYAIAGYGIVDGKANALQAVTFGAVTTKAHTPMPDRLHEIYTDFTELLATFRPDAVAVESLFYQSNKTTAIAVAEARGVILLSAKQAGATVFEYTPLQVKQGVTGYGKAAKRQVQQMVVRLLQLKAVPKPDDAADALAIAICHAHAAHSAQLGRHKTHRQLLGYE